MDASVAKNNFETHLINFKPIPWTESAPGFRYKAISQGHKKIRIVEFSKEFVEPDWCLKGHIGYVIDGEMEIEFEGSIQRFKTGDGIFISGGPANKHRHYSTIKTTTIFLVEEA